MTIPDSVVSLGDSAFAGCIRLTAATIGNGVTSIGTNAFSGCSLVSATIPDSVTNIGDGAFSGCFRLRNVTLPNSLTSLGGGAFSNCESLASVTIPSSLTSIADSTFYGCTEMDGVTIGSGVTSLGDGAFQACENLGSVTIPNSVTNIGDYSFGDCFQLSDVTLGNRVATLGGEVFHHCFRLASVTIPASVTSIGPAALDSADDDSNITSSFTAIPVDPLNPAYSSLDGVLFDKSQATLVQYPGGKPGFSYTIPASVTSIGVLAFYGSGPLASVTLPAGVTNLGLEAFTLCPNLEALYFQGNAPAADSSVFYGENYVTVDYLPGTIGWGSTFAGRPTAPWALPYPLILSQSNGSALGVQSNGFSFVISWATNVSVAVEAAESLVNPVWTPVATNTLAGGVSYFTDSGWTNYPARFYRIASP